MDGTIPLEVIQCLTQPELVGPHINSHETAMFENRGAAGVLWFGPHCFCLACLLIFVRDL